MMFVFMSIVVPAATQGPFKVCRKEDVGTVNVKLKYDGRRAGDKVPLIPEYIYGYEGEPQSAWENYAAFGPDDLGVYGAADERPEMNGVDYITPNLILGRGSAGSPYNLAFETGPWQIWWQWKGYPSPSPDKTGWAFNSTTSAQCLEDLRFGTWQMMKQSEFFASEFPDDPDDRVMDTTEHATFWEGEGDVVSNVPGADYDNEEWLGRPLVLHSSEDKTLFDMTVKGFCAYGSGVPADTHVEPVSTTENGITDITSTLNNYSRPYSWADFYYVPSLFSDDELAELDELIDSHTWCKQLKKHVEENGLTGFTVFGRDWNGCRNDYGLYYCRSGDTIYCDSNFRDRCDSDATYLVNGQNASVHYYKCKMRKRVPGGADVYIANELSGGCPWNASMLYDRSVVSDACSEYTPSQGGCSLAEDCYGDEFPCSPGNTRGLPGITIRTPPAAPPAPPSHPPDLPPPSPPSSPSPPASPLTILDDPHVVDPEGGALDFRGEDGVIYNLISHSHVSVNVLFEHADYRPKRVLIHGSYMREVYITAHTNTSQEVHIEYAAKKPLSAAVSVGTNMTDISTNGRKTVDDIAISLNGRVLKVATPDWVLLARSKVNPKIVGAATCATGRCFLSISTTPLFNARLAAVAPHGLLGQSYDGDGVGIVGAMDNYQTSTDEFTTSANGEGAIEGEAHDYKMASKFATDFPFSRFGKKSAPPRNISFLSGVKVKQVHGSNSHME